MSTPADDAPLGLPDLDPAEPPEGLFERLTAIAVDPSTPPVDDALIPADSPAGGGESGGDEVDLADLDDDEDLVAGAEAPAEEAGPAADPEDPLADPLTDPCADPFADPAAEHDGAADPGYGDEDLGGETDGVYDDLDPGV